MSSLAGGRFVLSWLIGYMPGNATFTYQGAIVAANATPGAIFDIGNGRETDRTGNRRRLLDSVTLANGNVAIVYAVAAPSGSSDGAVVSARIFDPTGQGVGSFTVGSSVTGQVSAVALANGDLLVGRAAQTAILLFPPVCQLAMLDYQGQPVPALSHGHLPFRCASRKGAQPSGLSRRAPSRADTTPSVTTSQQLRHPFPSVPRHNPENSGRATPAPHGPARTQTIDTPAVGDRNAFALKFP